MVEVKVENLDYKLPTISRKLWNMYCDQDYWKGNQRLGIEPGYRPFVQHLIPEARVSGDVIRLTLTFENDANYTMFLLKWS